MLPFLRVCIPQFEKRSRNPERNDATISRFGERFGEMSLSCSRQVREAVYLTGESNAMHVSKLATWIIAGVIGLAGASVLWQQQVKAADAASAKDAEPAVGNPANATCLACHGNEGFAMPGADGQMRQLHVIKDKFGKSVHGKRACQECHNDITEIPHKPGVTHKVSCVTCHVGTSTVANRLALPEGSMVRPAVIPRDRTSYTMPVVWTRIDQLPQGAVVSPTSLCMACHAFD